MMEMAQTNVTATHFPRPDLLPKVVGVEVKNCWTCDGKFSFGYRTAITKQCALTTRSPLRCVASHFSVIHSFAFVRPSGISPLDFRTALLTQAADMLTWGERLHVRDYDERPPRNRWRHGAWLEVRDFADPTGALKYIERIRAQHVEFDNLDRARRLKFSDRKTTRQFPDRWMIYSHAFLKRKAGSANMCKYQLQKELISHE